MKASDVQQVVSQAQKVEQMQQALAHQAAAQQQAAAQKVEERRLEALQKAEKADPRPERSAVYNDERRDGREDPRRGAGKRRGKGRLEGPAAEAPEGGRGIDRLA